MQASVSEGRPTRSDAEMSEEHGGFADGANA